MYFGNSHFRMQNNWTVSEQPVGPFAGATQTATALMRLLERPFLFQAGNFRETKHIAPCSSACDR